MIAAALALPVLLYLIWWTADAWMQELAFAEEGDVHPLAPWMVIATGFFCLIYGYATTTLLR